MPMPELVARLDAFQPLFFRADSGPAGLRRAYVIHSQMAGHSFDGDRICTSASLALMRTSWSSSPSARRSASTVALLRASEPYLPSVSAAARRTLASGFSRACVTLDIAALERSGPIDWIT